jgi:ribosomal protein L11 methylase PrmA
VAATDSNARANAVLLARVERLDLRTGPVPEAGTVAANLMRPLLLRVAAQMRDRPSALIVSGLLEQEADEVAAAFAPMAERRRLFSKGWAALCLA